MAKEQPFYDENGNENPLVPDIAGRPVTVTTIGGDLAIPGEAAQQLTFAQASDLFSGNIIDASEEYDGWGTILDDKHKLVGVPFIVVKWLVNEGDFGPFVTLYVLTGNDDHYILNDGSTGIKDQILRIQAKRQADGGLVCKKGLRVSEYTYFDEKLQKDVPAKTFYIDTSL